MGARLGIMPRITPLTAPRPHLLCTNSLLRLRSRQAVCFLYVKIFETMITKKLYLQPATENIPLHAGELMIPPVNVASDGTETGPLNPTPGAPQRLGKLYI